MKSVTYGNPKYKTKSNYYRQNVLVINEHMNKLVHMHPYNESNECASHIQDLLKSSPYPANGRVELKSCNLPGPPISHQGLVYPEHGHIHLHHLLPSLFGSTPTPEYPRLSIPDSPDQVLLSSSHHIAKLQ